MKNVSSFSDLSTEIQECVNACTIYLNEFIKSNIATPTIDVTSKNITIIGNGIAQEVDSFLFNITASAFVIFINITLSGLLTNIKIINPPDSGLISIQNSYLQFENSIVNPSDSFLYSGIHSFSSSLNIRNSSFIYNGTKENNPRLGGAIFMVEGNLYIESSNFEFNSANSGGALNVFDCRNVIINQSTFKNNKATSTGGGAVFLSNTTANFNYINASSNLAGSEGNFNSFGGWLMIRAESKVDISNLDCRSNSAMNGGCISVLELSALVIRIFNYKINIKFTNRYFTSCLLLSFN